MKLRKKPNNKKIVYNKMGNQKTPTLTSRQPLSNSPKNNDILLTNKLLEDLSISIASINKRLTDIESLKDSQDVFHKNTNKQFHKLFEKVSNLKDDVETINFECSQLTEKIECLETTIDVDDVYADADDSVEDEDEDDDGDSDEDEDEDEDADADSDEDDADEVYRMFQALKSYGLNKLKTMNYCKNELKIHKELLKKYLENKSVGIDQACVAYFISQSIDEKNKLLEDELKISTIISENPIPYRYRIGQFNLPDSIKRKVIQRMNIMSASEENKGKWTQWIDGFMEIPWNTYASMPININSPLREIHGFLSNARDTLDKVAYGQNKTKEHIIEVMSKMITNPGKVGNVFCIHGPMGTGKTTLIKNGMAKALGLPFIFISLGGMQDSSHLVGHDYTYEGSTSGRIVEGLKSCKCMNPIIYFDELDKVSSSSSGLEIINLLIHLTDSSQNSDFQDKYYSEIPFDLSKAIFVFSMNDLESVNPILRDRMHMIKVDKFVMDDKLKIAREFLLPEITSGYGLKPDDLIFSDSILRHIIMKTTETEDGVRGIKKRLETIVSKMNVVKLLNSTDVLENTNKKRKLNKTTKSDDIDIANELKKKNNILHSISVGEIKFPLEVDLELLNKLFDKEDDSNFPYYMYS